MTNDDRQRAAAAAPDEDAPASEGIEVEPLVLVWARTSIGLDEDSEAL